MRPRELKQTRDFVGLVAPSVIGRSRRTSCKQRTPSSPLRTSGNRGGVRRTRQQRFPAAADRHVVVRLVCALAKRVPPVLCRRESTPGTSTAMPPVPGGAEWHRRCQNLRSRNRRVDSRSDALLQHVAHLHNVMVWGSLQVCRFALWAARKVVEAN